MSAHHSPVVARLGIILLGLLCTTSTPAIADFGDIYTSGHADIDIVYTPATQSLRLDYSFASNAVINGSILGSAGAGHRAPNTITVFVGDNGRALAPGGLPSPFSGNLLWSVPQSSRPARPFLGIGSPDVEPGLFRDDTFTVTLSAMVQRPPGGEFIVWQSGSESTPYFNSADGLTPDDHLTVSSGGHDHYHFGFNVAGTYDVRLTASGTLTNGTVLSASDVFRFQVSIPVSIPEPGSVALCGLGLGILLAPAARRRLSARALPKPR
ncbi:MAG: choice-of-anchor M domain-containing protein [Isosphaeraceae bacterium]|nr:choice-of-anchor M domain-containing protein [Isosphaeraceae bacterium]